MGANAHTCFVVLLLINLHSQNIYSCIAAWRGPHSTSRSSPDEIASNDERGTSAAGAARTPRRARIPCAAARHAGRCAVAPEIHATEVETHHTCSMSIRTDQVVSVVGLVDRPPTKYERKGRAALGIAARL